jgi:hypothetical protein
VFVVDAMWMYTYSVRKQLGARFRSQSRNRQQVVLRGGWWGMWASIVTWTLPSYS